MRTIVAIDPAVAPGVAIMSRPENGTATLESGSIPQTCTRAAAVPAAAPDQGADRPDLDGFSPGN